MIVMLLVDGTVTVLSLRQHQQQVCHSLDADSLGAMVMSLHSLDLPASETSPNTVLRHGHPSSCFGSLTNTIEYP